MRYLLSGFVQKHRRVICICGVFLAILLTTVFLRSRDASSYKKICNRCNVILITIDSLRSDALPCYGYGINTAPHICAFAKQNIQFTKSYTNSSWTLPSQMSLFTGLYPKSHGMTYTYIDHLNPSIPTLPKILASNGYETHVVSNVQPNVGLDQGLLDGFSSVQFTKPDLSDAIPQWIEAIHAIKSANARHKPAFVYLHTDTVHNYLDRLADPPPSFPLDPTYIPPNITKQTNDFDTLMWEKMKEQFAFIMNTDKVKNSDKQYTTLYTQLQIASTLHEAKHVFDTLPLIDQNAILWQYDKEYFYRTLGTNYIPLIRHLYDNEINSTDTYIQRVFDALTSDHLMHNTIVIITSQHGEYLGEHNRFGHGQDLSDIISHVPLIMHIPRLLPYRTDALIGLNDLYATIQTLVGIHASIPQSSMDLSSVIQQDRHAETRTFVIAQWSDTHAASIYADTWHVLEKNPGSNTTTLRELYDITKDPQESHNLINEYASVADTLADILHTSLNSQPVYAPTTSRFPDWIDEKHKANLIKTGYY